MENIQEKFFSKNNITLLNNKLLENLNVKNLNDKQRVFIAETIVSIMKNIWKTIDISKIKPDNFQSVLSQFNNIVYKNSFNDINKLINPPKENVFVDPNAKKFERDFHSTPNDGVIVHDRPKSMKETSNHNHSHIGPNEDYIKQSQKRHELAGQPDRHLDDLFRPIVDEIGDEPRFNNYTKGHEGGDFKEKLHDIQRMRDTEVPMQKKGDILLPTFLQPKATSVRSQEDYSEKRNMVPENRKQQNSSQNNNNITFIDGADDNENLYSLDNIDKPLIDNDDFVEDPSSFADRLNKLQNVRGNIEIPKQKSVDFKSDTYADDFNDIKPTSIDKLKNKKDYNEENNSRRNYNEENNSRRNYNEENNKPNKNKQSNKITVEQREIFDRLKTLNKKLMLQLTSCKEENNQLRHDNLELAEKLQEIIHKENLLDEKEKELDTKYGAIINTKTFQLEINPESSISSYKYNFNNTLNVTGIKLIACSIPFKKYNIEDDINNLFLYTFNNIQENIILHKGFYTIQEIIEKLNLNQNNLVFELNSVNQKIKVTSNSKFNIVPTTFSMVCLGFKSNCNNNNIYNADTTYDLRINNKVYLYFKNISDDPISIITPNTNIYDSEILFENVVKLNYLDISFKDEYNNDYNFYNISHYIHLNLITNNIT